MSLTHKEILARLIAEYGEIGDIFLDDVSDGICHNCGEIQFGGVEPDARNYHCDSCGDDAVFGIEETLFTLI